MSNASKLVVNNIGSLQVFESAQKIRRKEFQLELQFCESEVVKSPQYIEVANYIDDLSVNCLVTSPRNNYLVVNAKTIVAINEILEKHSKIFLSIIVSKGKRINEIMGEKGLSKIVITANDVRTIYMSADIEMMGKLPKNYNPVSTSFKEGFKALRDPVTFIVSLSMIGYMMGENFRQIISEAILEQGKGLQFLLLASLLGYGIYAGITKYKSVIEEKHQGIIELTHTLKKTIHAAAFKTITEQLRLYKSAIDRAIMTS